METFLPDPSVKTRSRIKPQHTRNFLVAWFGPASGKTFEELKTIEVARRKLLIHTKTGNSLLFLTSFTGTLLPYVLTDYLFWLTLIAYCFVRYLIWKDPMIMLDLPPIMIPQVSVVGGFLSFFLVFFTSQSYSRFLQQYNKLMAAKGSIFNIAFLCKAHLPRPRALRLVRWLNACHLLAYVGLSTVYQYDNFFLPLCEAYKLLTPVELERVRSVGADAAGGIAYREILAWVSAETSTLSKEKLMPDKISDSMWKETIKVRENLAFIFDNDDQPIPFVYVHLIYLITLFFLPIVGYAVAINVAPEQQKSYVEVVGIIIIFLTCLFVLGLRDLGHILQNPFGDDLQDMSVMHYFTYTMQMSRRILLGSRHGACDEETEFAMESMRPGLGPGFSEDIASTTASEKSTPLPLPVSKVAQKAGVHTDGC